MSDENKPALDDSDTVSMMDILEEQSRMQEDASAVLGCSDDKHCTYAKGYVKRQALYACSTCATSEPAGICLACSYHCHEGHELYELYTKRHFRCDCGNSKFKETRCKLDWSKTEVNEENQYNQNFRGSYCICCRPYPDPEDETEDEMIQCVVCEDWYHGRHLGTDTPTNENYQEMICAGCMGRHQFLWAYYVNSPAMTLKDEAGEEGKVDVETEQQSGEKESTVAPQTQVPGSDQTHTQEPASDQRDTQEPASDQRDTQEPDSDQRDTQEPASDQRDTQEPGSDQTHTQEPGSNQTHTQEPDSDQTHTQEPGSDQTHTQEPGNDQRDTQESRKRSSSSAACPGEVADTACCSTSASTEHEPPAKRLKTEEATSSDSSSEKSCLLLDLQRRKITVKDHAAFWQDAWREKLCTCSACMSMYKEEGVEYLVDMTDTVCAYEEVGRGKDEALSDQEQEQHLLSGMNHVQKIEMINGFMDMKTQLSSFLTEFARSGKVVTEGDIRGFFAGMEERRKKEPAPGTQYFCK